MLTEALPELRVGLVHGRMRPAEKERGMQALQRKDSYSYSSRQR